VDIALHVNENNEADIAISNGLVATDTGITTAINLSLFGGNTDGSSWWADELDSNLANTLTNEFLSLQDKVLISANLPGFQAALTKNLQWITDNSIAGNYVVECSIIDITTLQIDILISDLDFKYTTYAKFK